MKKYFFYILVLSTLLSCSSKKWVLTDYKTSKISIDSSLNSIADKNMTAFIAPIKQSLDKEMNQVIGQSAEEMTVGKPESLLSNWNADVYREAATDFLKSPVDIGIVNLGGLRTSLPKGNITVRNIFEQMPFENELVLLWLKGSDVKELMDIFALEGGQGISGIRFEIKDKKAVNISVNGQLLDENKTYIIATSDYLAGGNDRMIPLTKAVKRMDTGLKLRNILMEKVIRENRKGNKIQSELDGRIKTIQ
ncbi:5'-Nucleotidase domain-containing protein [uncultured Paludibacter sp.]|uniref:5'-Nucleotidase domain-containing protein n=1 Tax=uncultured Paludibacter sp. TaxID=497635 RepID=A0A653AJ17_9BACT|nr:5'-Nucleotidase domain-containing protein [uncultured Paludibacter sp.]